MVESKSNKHTTKEKEVEKQHLDVKINAKNPPTGKGKGGKGGAAEEYRERKPYSGPADGRIPAVDKKSYDDKIEVLLSAVKELRSKVDTLNKEIESKSEGKDEFIRKRDEAKSKTDEQQKIITEFEAQRAKIAELIAAKLKESRDMRADLSEKQKKIGYTSEEQIDKEIAEIEYAMHTETMNLKREKELMAKIAKLKQLKPDLRQLGKLDSAVKNARADDSIGALKEQQANLQKQISEARDEKRKHQAVLTKILEARKKAMEGMGSVFDERNALQEQVKEKYAEVKQIRDEKNEKIREFNALVAEQRLVRAEKEKAEKAVRDAELEKQRLEKELERDAEVPFIDEIELIENSIKYCEALLPREVEKEVEAPKEYKAISGATVLLKKNVREPIEQGARGKKANRKAEKAESAPAAPKTVKHTLDTLQIFARVKIEAPASLADVPKTVEELRKKHGEYLQKQVKEISERKARRAEREAAVKEAAAHADAARAEAAKVIAAQASKAPAVAAH